MSSFPISIGHERDLHDTTPEGGPMRYFFWLEIAGARVTRPVVRSIRVGDSIPAHAAAALQTILANPVPSLTPEPEDKHSVIAPERSGIVDYDVTVHITQRATSAEEACNAMRERLSRLAMTFTTFFPGGFTVLRAKRKEED